MCDDKLERVYQYKLRLRPPSIRGQLGIPTSILAITFESTSRRVELTTSSRVDRLESTRLRSFEEVIDSTHLGGRGSRKSGRSAALFSPPHATLYSRVGPVLPIGLLVDKREGKQKQNGT